MSILLAVPFDYENEQSKRLIELCNGLFTSSQQISELLSDARVHVDEFPPGVSEHWVSVFLAAAKQARTPMLAKAILRRVPFERSEDRDWLRGLLDATPQHRVMTVVVMRVEYQATIGKKALDRDEAMLQLFGYSEKVSLKKNSTSQYLAGNYEGLDGSANWTGELVQLHAGETLKIVHLDDGRVTFETNEEDLAAIQGRTRFVYMPEKSLLAIWERAELPYTRFSSYVKQATRRARAKGLDIGTLSLQPVADQSNLVEKLRMFDQVQKIKFTYKHSQSPGRKYIDRSFTLTGAQERTVELKAPPGGELNVAAIIPREEIATSDVESSDPIAPRSPEDIDAEIVAHIHCNPRNGTVLITGLIDGNQTRVNTRDNIARAKVMAPMQNVQRTADAIALLVATSPFAE